MKTPSRYRHHLFALASLALASALTITASAADPIPIKVTPDFPADLNSGDAPNATFEQAAAYAWQEFIALNWPALPGKRDTPDPGKKFGETPTAWSASNPAALVWETARHKVEIFPGTGNPNGYVNDAASDYGYDAAPEYNYAAPVAADADNKGGTNVPWINLDEKSQIGLNMIYAGNTASDTSFPGNIILFMAKANRGEYSYVAGHKFWEPPTAAAGQTTQAILNGIPGWNGGKPQVPAPDDPEVAAGTLISFPYGTIEFKAAWRRLGPDDDASKFHTAPVRYYKEVKKSDDVTINTYFNSGPSEVWGLIGLHIIHKTEGAPYFIYATFEQTDNLLTADGKPVEDGDGNVTNGVTPGLDAGGGQTVTSTNATKTAAQILKPATADSKSGDRIYYENSGGPAKGLPQGPISVNQRLHPIPQAIIDANATAHSAISAYNTANKVTTSPWLNYKLANVQWVPIDKAAGVTYAGGTKTPGGVILEDSTYYQNNSVIETDYNLQVFSGQFSNGYLITDFANNPYGPTPANPNPPFAAGSDFKNTFYNVDSKPVPHNMGGCMGCHGNAQVGGYDFSFLLMGGRVAAPEGVDPTGEASLAAKHLKMALSPKK